MSSAKQEKNPKNCPFTGTTEHDHKNGKNPLVPVRTGIKLKHIGSTNEAYDTLLNHTAWVSTLLM
jgi:hypothetical protein